MSDPFPIVSDPSGPHAGIAVIRLEQPGKPVVVLDHALIQRLEATLNVVPRSSVGLILASASERVFIAGADLKSVAELSDDQLLKYLAYGSKVFGMLAAFRFPTVAAINGAALGGGLELAMHCDFLVAAPSASGKPYPVGLPEAGLSICPGWGGTCLLPARMNPADAIRRTATGTPMTLDEAKAAELFSAVAPTAADLITTAKKMILTARKGQRLERDGAPSHWIGRRAAATLAALNSVRDEIMTTDSGRAVAEAIDAGLSKGWQAALQVEQRQLTHLRNTPSGKQAISDFFAKAAKK